MENAKWTNEQREAISDRGCNLLIAAGAGAGKTAVLVERIIRMIVDEESPVDIDKLLVVTFTNAAAAEMRERIGDAITRELDRKPESKRLQRQLTLLGRANVMTIHSFCLSVIKCNFHLLDIEPDFRVCNDTEAILLKQEVMDDLFEDKFEKDDQEFLKIIKALGEGNDLKVQALIQNLYSFAVSTPWPKKWLLEIAEKFNVGPDLDFGASEWAQSIMEDVIIETGGCLKKMKRATEIIEKNSELAKYMPLYKEEIQALEELLKAGSWEEMKEGICEMRFGRLPSLTKLTEESTAQKEKVKNVRNSVKEEILGMGDIIFKNTEDAGKNMGFMYPYLKYLSGITIEFEEKFSQKKREKGIIDFNDIEHFALEILRGVDGPSQIAEEYRRRFQEILIDEYQDSNLVQEVILSTISRTEEGNLFMVGDVKQSIYRFRHAKPELFLKKYETYGTTAGMPGKKIKLYRNFRSRKTIIAGVNYIFSQIMSSGLGELEYNVGEELQYGAAYEDKENSVEINLIDRNEDGPEEDEELDKTQIEARLVSKRILQLFRDGFQVYDKETKAERNIMYKDIVILMRATEGRAGAFLEELSGAGIPAFADTSTGYFETTEIKTIMAILQIVDNPLQDIPMIAVLRSPVFMFTPEELVSLRMADKDSSFYDILKFVKEEDPLKEKVEGFLEKLRSWRDKAAYLPIDEFIWFIYSETAYYSFVATLPQGEQRQANLRLLFERAKEFESTSYKGLFNFINFIDKLKNSSGDMGSAKILGENQDVVRIMSIHKSKGLEFPVVILSGAGNKFNMMDTSRNILFHQELGYGPDFVDYERRISYPTLVKQVIKRKVMLETLSEEMRILYVAFTRAKEKLIITGTVKNISKNCNKWCEAAAYPGRKIPEHYVAGSASYLDWICAAVARSEEGEAIRVRGAGNDIDCAEDCSKWNIRIWSKAELTSTLETSEEDVILKILEGEQKEAFDEEIENQVCRRLQWQYKYSESSRIPAKLSVSDLKSAGYEIKEELKAPSFIKGDKKITAALRGTLLHMVMQHLDLKRVSSIREIENQIKGLIEKEYIREDEAAAVNISRIFGFFNSDLGQRMIASPGVNREVPFFIEMDAVDIYPELPQEVYGLEKVVLQGVIDCYFEEKDGLILVDYKTDFVENAEDLAEKYRMQIDLYSKALEKVTGKKITERYLYLFNVGSGIKV
ncbi:MAG: helicase-exonuclease AddAB subunit AddA [Clostridiaceae bacterium]